MTALAANISAFLFNLLCIATASVWFSAPAPSFAPLDPPGRADAFRLLLEHDGFELDAHADTWHRLKLPLDRLAGSGEFDRREVETIVFQNGGFNPVERTLWFDRVTALRNDDEAFLEMVQRRTFDYFWLEANPYNGLVKDRSTAGSPASIAATGFGLSAVVVGIDRGWITPEDGRERVLSALEFFWKAPQSTAPDATGYKGFFYHFLDMNTGRRAWQSELSTVDTALLLAGVMHVREYFEEDEAVRSMADSIYQRVDWPWMQFRHPTNPSAAISHGWYPDPEGRANAGPNGFIRHDWIGYNEAMILYVLALGSPTHPVEPQAWEMWTSGYRWETRYGFSFVVFPPLFGHQYSHVWIDFRGRRDAYMRDRGIDYFENSRRATLAQRAYHVSNPQDWPNYGADEWGLTASDVPGGYSARGASPALNDDGTIAPTAPGGSIVFTPEESIAALRTMYSRYPDLWGSYGFRDAYNVAEDWFDKDYLGIDQGPILLMIENYRTESVWDVVMESEAVRRGLTRAGFGGDTVGTENAPSSSSLVLEPNFPNPFARGTVIAFELPQSGRTVLRVYDVPGRIVAVPIDGVLSGGLHRVRFDGSGLAPGLYVYVLEHGKRRLSRSMLVIR